MPDEITTSNDSTEKVVVETDKTVVVSDDSNSGKKSSVGLSSQMQLLGLAKKFVLDGALISTEKQMPLEDRARKRERLNHLRQQQNLEAIIHKAVPYCSSSEITARADQDWFNSYITLAEGVSNQIMQELWAKILAGEISKPGSFSLKALKAFRTMSINEAKLLAKACGVAVKDQSKKNIRIISGTYQTPGVLNMFDKKRQVKINLAHWGLSYSELLVLADNNLIFIQETESNVMAKGETVQFSYNGMPLLLTAQKANCVLSFYKFTPIGVELANLIADDPEQEFIDELKRQINHHFDAS